MDSDPHFEACDAEDVIEELQDQQQQLNTDRMLFSNAQNAVQEALKDALTQKTISSYEK